MQGTDIDIIVFFQDHFSLIKPSILPLSHSLHTQTPHAQTPKQSSIPSHLLCLIQELIHLNRLEITPMKINEWNPENQCLEMLEYVFPTEIVHVPGCNHVIFEQKQALFFRRLPVMDWLKLVLKWLVDYKIMYWTPWIFYIAP